MFPSLRPPRAALLAACLLTISATPPGREAPGLRADEPLYRDVEVSQAIPEDRYAAVAEVLAYVYQLKGKDIPGTGRAA